MYVCMHVGEVSYSHSLLNMSQLAGENSQEHLLLGGGAKASFHGEGKIYTLCMHMFSVCTYVYMYKYVYIYIKSEYLTEIVNEEQAAELVHKKKLGKLVYLMLYHLLPPKEQR